MKCPFDDKQCSLYYDASRIPIGCRHGIYFNNCDIKRKERAKRMKFVCRYFRYRHGYCGEEFEEELDAMKHLAYGHNLLETEEDEE